MYNWNASYPFIQWFFKLYKNAIFRIIKKIVWLEIAMIIKTKKRLHNAEPI